MNKLLNELGQRAQSARRILSQLDTETKDRALQRIADTLRAEKEQILAENMKDLERGAQDGLSKALLDRLRLTGERVEGVATGVEEVIELDDPIGSLMAEWDRPNGLKLQRIRVPLGVIGMIYEARPNVSVDASVLCLKTGNAVILRGSSSALQSNMALVTAMRRALDEAGLPVDAIQLVQDTSRATAAQFMRLSDYLDVLIPRGGAGLIKNTVQNASVPVLETGVGNCHIYIDASADTKMAQEIVLNAKTQRPSVCNAAETVLVHKEWAERSLAQLIEQLSDAGVECRGCPQTAKLGPSVVEATEEDWSTEFLDLVLAIKIVDGLDEAISHINQYSSTHTEAIVTEEIANAEAFLKQVDSSSVFWNASTRFADGFEYGFGAEIGISTQKLHARGPMGLEALTSYKYVVRGSGQVRG